MSTGKEPFQVSTQRPRHAQATPRLPNERDESDDSQESPIRADIKQAFDDLMSGQQDTDMREQRGVEEVVKAHLESIRKRPSGR